MAGNDLVITLVSCLVFMALVGCLAAAGIRVPVAVGDFLILRAVRESGGFAIAVDDDSISAGLDEVSRQEGLLLCLRLILRVGVAGSTVTDCLALSSPFRKDGLHQSTIKRKL